MGKLRLGVLVLSAFQILLMLLQQIQVQCYQYKVGDLHAWGIPSSSNPKIYTYWTKYHPLKIGDSLLFLYPPSQDSVIQVTEENYNSCNLKNPILYMNNGNSLFNITENGEYYFTSGANDHCEKKQKLRISVGNGTSSAFAPSYGPSAVADSAAPSYQNVFGSIPQPPSPSSSTANGFSILLSVAVTVVASIFTVI